MLVQSDQLITERYYAIRIHKQHVEVLLLTQDQIRKMVQKTECIRNKIMIEFMYISGVRCSEAAKILIEDIDFESGEGYYHWIRDCKGGKDRKIFISKQLLLKMKGYLVKGRPSGLVF